MKISAKDYAKRYVIPVYVVQEWFRNYRKENKLSGGAKVDIDDMDKYVFDNHLNTTWFYHSKEYQRTLKRMNSTSVIIGNN